MFGASERNNLLNASERKALLKDELLSETEVVTPTTLENTFPSDIIIDCSVSYDDELKRIIAAGDDLRSIVERRTEELEKIVALSGREAVAALDNIKQDERRVPVGLELSITKDELLKYEHMVDSSAGSYRLMEKWLQQTSEVAALDSASHANMRRLARQLQLDNSTILERLRKGEEAMLEGIVRTSIG